MVRNRVLFVLVLAGLLAGSSLAFLTLAPNRLVSGMPLGLGTAPRAWVLLVPGAVLTGGAPCLAADLAFAFPLLAVGRAFTFEERACGGAKFVVDVVENIAAHVVFLPQLQATIAGKGRVGGCITNSRSPSRASSCRWDAHSASTRNPRAV